MDKMVYRKSLITNNNEIKNKKVFNNTSIRDKFHLKKLDFENKQQNFHALQSQ